LRLESVRWKEDAELLALLPEEKRTSIICTFVLPCHLGPAQLNLYEPANRNQNAAYSEQKEGPRQTLPYRQGGTGKLQKGEGLYLFLFRLTVLTRREPEHSRLYDRHSRLQKPRKSESLSS